jgi:hypothetical protein
LETDCIKAIGRQKAKRKSGIFWIASGSAGMENFGNDRESLFQKHTFSDGTQRAGNWENFGKFLFAIDRVFQKFPKKSEILEMPLP